MIKYLVYTALAMLALYFLLRLAGAFTFSKIVDAELEKVIKGDEHKVKGKYD